MRKSPTLSYVPARLSQVPTLWSRTLHPDIVLVHGDTTTSFAAALAAFTVAASVVGHAFWKTPRSPERTGQVNAFLANIGLVGGLALAVALAEGVSR